MWNTFSSVHDSCLFHTGRISRAEAAHAHCAFTLAAFDASSKTAAFHSFSVYHVVRVVEKKGYSALSVALKVTKTMQCLSALSQPKQETIWCIFPSCHWTATWPWAAPEILKDECRADEKHYFFWLKPTYKAKHNLQHCVHNNPILVKIHSHLFFFRLPINQKQC